MVKSTYNKSLNIGDSTTYFAFKEDNDGILFIGIIEHQNSRAALMEVISNFTRVKDILHIGMSLSNIEGLEYKYVHKETSSKCKLDGIVYRVIPHNEIFIRGLKSARYLQSLYDSGVKSVMTEAFKYMPLLSKSKAESPYDDICAFLEKNQFKRREDIKNYIELMERLNEEVSHNLFDDFMLIYVDKNPTIKIDFFKINKNINQSF